MSKLKAFFKNTSLFRIIYIIDLFFCNIAYIQLPAYVLLAFLFVWGVGLVFYNQVHRNTFMRLRFGLWIGAFLFCSLLTLLLHLTGSVFSVLQSVVMLLHVGICFFVFYGVHTERKTNIKAEFYTICRFVIYATTIAGAVGVLCLMCGVSFESAHFEWLKVIIYENRFTGVYINPNLLGFCSVVSLICCHMMMKADFIKESGQKRISRIWIVFCLGLDAISILLCDSNASLVLIICYVIAYIVFKLFSAENKMTIRQVLLKLAALCCAGVIVVSSAFFFRLICQKGFSAIVRSTASQSETVTNAESKPVTFSHVNPNLDSGRFKLIKESMKLFKISPVIGISNGNIVLYSQEYADGVMSYTYHKNDLHNGYLTILVSTGLIGFLIFASFGLRFAKHVIQHLFTDTNSLSMDIFPCLFSFLCAYLVYALFEKALLYDISFMVMWFWLNMGVISTYLNKYEPISGSGYLFRKRRLRRFMI